MEKIILKINGMMCGMCESHINDAIRNAFNPKKVSSSHSKGECIILTESNINNHDIKKVIDSTGYELVDIIRAPYKKKGLFNFLNK